MSNNFRINKTNNNSFKLNRVNNTFRINNNLTIDIPTPISIEPLYISNGYLSILRVNDIIDDSEFPNTVVTNGYLSVLRVGDNVPDSEFPNAVIGNGYLSVLYNDTI